MQAGSPKMITLEGKVLFEDTKRTQILAGVSSRRNLRSVMERLTSTSVCNMLLLVEEAEAEDAK